MNNVLSFFFRLFFWILLIIVLIGIALFSLDVFEIHQTRNYFPGFMRTKLFNEVSSYSMLSNSSLNEIRIIKEREAIDIRNQQLEKLGEELKAKEDDLKKLETELLQKQKVLDEKQKIIDDIVGKYNNEDLNIAQTATYLMNMPPEDAVKRLEELNDEVAISYIRKTEDISLREGRPSIVPYWLSLMDPKRASVLMRKMSVSSLE